MADIIKEREEDIDKIEGIMMDINDIAKDIGIEIQGQGDKLDTLDTMVDKAVVNMKQGNKELDKAEKN